MDVAEATQVSGFISLYHLSKDRMNTRVFCLFLVALLLKQSTTYLVCRVPTRPGKPGKPGKMRVHLENLEISWNFEKFNKYHGKMT